MCGIVGQFDSHETGAEIDRLLESQLERLRHRGPDDTGIYRKFPIAFGHVRLAIIDPEQGQQPLVTPQEDLAITYNGEVYNYLELREELEAKGHRFQTRSDTEVLLLGYREWGTDVLAKLNGMFAFALYDRKKDLLFCARDPFGQKPFYYLLQNGIFHFASESRVFFMIPGFSRSLDPESLYGYLRFEALHRDRSIYQGVKKLSPGHFLIVQKGGIRLQKYFHQTPQEIAQSFPEALDQVDAAFQNALRLAFRADVPVGVLLSGGLDSSLVLAALRRMMPQAEIASYHVRVTDDPSYDESKFAKEVAALCKANYHQIDFSFSEMASTALRVLPALDEPQADPGIVPKYVVCKAIREHGKVALTGDGADELFYGYLIFRAQVIARWYKYLPSAVHLGVVKPLMEALPSGSGYMRKDFLAKRFVRGFPSEEALRNSRWTSSFSASDLTDLLQTDFVQGVEERATEFLRELDSESESSGHLGKLAYLYQKTYLPDYVLCNSDRASMLNSVELRTPYLDLQLTALANQLPDRFKMPRFHLKYLQRKLAERYLPKELIYRKKMGFTIPAAQLVRTELKSEIEAVFSESLLKKQGIFRHESVKRLLAEHFSGRENHYKQIWTLFSLQKWILENLSA